MRPVPLSGARGTGVRRPATACKTDPIRKITRMGRSGTGFMIDMGKRPNGKRDQRC
jgi:hypothetical protein